VHFRGPKFYQSFGFAAHVTGRNDRRQWSAIIGSLDIVLGEIDR
jgi:NADH:ubiquinone oxidoreductase subunit D